MKLLFIYGLPAVGKLTVAKELEKLIDYRLFHNHATLDLVHEIYPDYGENCWLLTKRLRLTVIESAAANGINLIFTYAYFGDLPEMKFIRQIVDIISSHGGSVDFVHLYAPHDVLLNRVGDETRESFHKLQDKEQLRYELGRHESDPTVPFDTMLSLDTSKITPKEASTYIANILNQ